MDQALHRLLALAGVLLTLFSGAARADLVALQERLEWAYHARDNAVLTQVHGQLLELARTGDSVEAARSGYLAAYARFRQALLSADDAPQAREHLDACIQDLHAVVARHPEDAEALALLGSCYGISTRYYPLALATRGLKARAHMAAARALAPDNPWVILQDGLADYATPRLFGGDRALAVAKLERAAARFGEAAGDGCRLSAWAATETWLQLARMYRETGRTAEAEQAAARARQAQPNPVELRLASAT